MCALGSLPIRLCLLSWKRNAKHIGEGLSLPSPTRTLRQGNRRNKISPLPFVQKKNTDGSMEYALGKKFFADIIPQFVKARNNKGITQANLDDILGVAKGLVSKWEVGIRKPSGYLFCCWADALDCDIKLEMRKDETTIT